MMDFVFTVTQRACETSSLIRTRIRASLLSQRTVPCSFGISEDRIAARSSLQRTVAPYLPAIGILRSVHGLPLLEGTVPSRFVLVQWTCTYFMCVLFFFS